MTIQEFKNHALEQIKNTSPTASLDISVLLEHRLKLNKTSQLLNRNQEIAQEDLTWLEKALQKRKTGLPVAYITNTRNFYGYDFYVDESVLIPKPDTEILVEMAVENIVTKMENSPNKILTICDMCTGSACIAISTFKSLLENNYFSNDLLPEFTLVDISKKALEVAAQNIKKLIPPEWQSNFHLVQSNLFEEVPQIFDIILTNPPYIPHKMVEALLKDGRNEPVRLPGNGTCVLYPVAGVAAVEPPLERNCPVDGSQRGHARPALRIVARIEVVELWVRVNECDRAFGHAGKVIDGAQAVRKR